MPLAHIALGANLPSPAGPPDATLAAAVEHIRSLGRVAARSSLYSTEPVGPADQPRFLNAVIALETDLAPRTLLDDLLFIERFFGRDRSRSVPNGPRTIDLDILLYGDLVLTEPGLEIPHPRLGERAFVLVPLAEIAPDLRVPPSGLTAAQLLADLDPRADAGAAVPVKSHHWPIESGSASNES
ncbi:MAG: 2-amino-4-hydroxy-6-hydroxymethyldihydropteridine diphosphokinase [Terracidiphilus sp.]|jgi:2-amino-4-hydroxy-6-hydroxymethyldihydropteridine diphosphokinase